MTYLEDIQWNTRSFYAWLYLQGTIDAMHSNSRFQKYLFYFEFIRSR